MRAVSADFTITMQRRLSERPGGKVPARARGLCEHPIAAVECPDLTLSEFGLTYSALILAARITFAHLAVSVLMTTANSSGELTDASRPSCAIRSRVSAFATIRSSSACTLLMMTTGVAVGANSPNQEM